MSLIYIKNPTEYFFKIWSNNLSMFSSHYLDAERFYKFIKSVYKYKAKKWDSEYLKKRILKKYPNYENSESLEDLLICFEQCLEILSVKILNYYEEDCDDKNNYNEFTKDGIIRREKVD